MSEWNYAPATLIGGARYGGEYWYTADRKIVPFEDGFLAKKWDHERVAYTEIKKFDRLEDAKEWCEGK